MAVLHRVVKYIVNVNAVPGKNSTPYKAHKPNNPVRLLTTGTAAGAPNSCSYADLAVFDIDKSVLQAKRNTFQEMRYFGRYRDDCLALRNGPLQKLELFLMFFNSIDSNLQFTIEAGENELCFLDLKLILKDNKIHTTVYSKPTDRYLYLQADSCHHLPSILGMQKGVALRLRRICLTDEEFNNKSKEYKAYLIDKRHTLKNVEKSFNDAFHDSNLALRKRKALTGKTRFFFVVSIIPWD